jgi:hypothetical protein
MGAWGPAIFSNDTSADVRGDLEDLLGEGLTAQEATERLTGEYGIAKPPDADPDMSVDFWLALALTQHRFGRLLPEVRDAALQAVGDPRELARWDPTLRRKRQSALDKAVAKLAEPQPPPRKVKPRVRCETGLIPGQHVIYTLDSGIRILLRVLSIHEDKGGRGPRVALLEWTDDDGIPANPAALPVRPDPRPLRREGEGMGFTLFGSPGDPVDRLQYVEPAQARRLLGVVTIRTRTAPEPRWISGWVSHWKNLDRFFAVDGQVQFSDERA